jgi:hypothetical protein
MTGIKVEENENIKIVDSIIKLDFIAGSTVD